MNIYTTLFKDIETVPEFPTFKLLPDPGKYTFKKRFDWKIRELYDKATNALPHGPVPEDLFDKIIEDVYQKEAGLLAEYSRIAVVSLGAVSKDNVIKIKSYCYPEEKQILTEAGAMMDFKAGDLPKWDALCAHNGLNFDFPFYTRRCFLNSVPLPALLQNFKKKKWEVPLLDTMEMWAAGQWGYKASIDAIAYAMGIPSPKITMDGSKVASVFRLVSSSNAEEAATAKTALIRYCEGDVITMIHCFMMMTGVPLITDPTKIIRA